MLHGAVTDPNAGRSETSFMRTDDCWSRPPAR
jgi:hypothetical protein